MGLRAPAAALVRACGARRRRSWCPCRRGTAFRAPRPLRRLAVAVERAEAGRTFSTRVRRAERASPPAGQLSSRGLAEGVLRLRHPGGEQRGEGAAKRAARPRRNCCFGPPFHGSHAAMRASSGRQLPEEVRHACMHTPQRALHPARARQRHGARCLARHAPRQHPTTRLGRASGPLDASPRP